MVNLEVIDKRDDWDQALLALPEAHALQSWDWGDFKSRWGWTAIRLLWRRAGRPLAAAQLLSRTIPRAPWRLLYVSKGPALDYANTALLRQVLSDLEERAKMSRAILVKIDPDVPRQYGAPSETQSGPDSVGQAVQQLLEQRGWRFSTEQIQFRNSIIIDLTAEPDQLLAQMKGKWRYNIRLAERRGVTVRSGSISDLPAFYQMYAQTARRDRFLIRPEAYYHDVWGQFMTAGRAEMLLAEVDQELVAGLILFIFGSKAWYMYGASTGQQRTLMPNHLLQWQAMVRAKSRGCDVYDMWGAPNTFDPSDTMWGVYRFKRGFGGQVVQGLGAFDYPARPTLYWTFNVIMPRARSLLRRTTRTKAG